MKSSPVSTESFDFTVKSSAVVLVFFADVATAPRLTFTSFAFALLAAETLTS